MFVNHDPLFKAAAAVSRGEVVHGKNDLGQHATVGTFREATNPNTQFGIFVDPGGDFYGPFSDAFEAVTIFLALGFEVVSRSAVVDDAEALSDPALIELEEAAWAAQQESQS